VKHPLVLVKGSTEKTTLVRGLLVGLRDRGLDVTRPILAVLDGAKALAAAVKEVFDHPVIGRGQLHKVRNVQDHLPEKLRSLVGQRIGNSENVHCRRRSCAADDDHRCPTGSSDTPTRAMTRRPPRVLHNRNYAALFGVSTSCTSTDRRPLTAGVHAARVPGGIDEPGQCLCELALRGFVGEVGGADAWPQREPSPGYLHAARGQTANAALEIVLSVVAELAVLATARRTSIRSYLEPSGHQCQMVAFTTNDYRLSCRE
jgi:hypothetical protein